MTRKELIYQLLNCQISIIYGQIEEIQRRIRYREIHSTDCIELLLALERLETLRELSKNIFAILRIDSLEFDKLCAERDEEINKQKLR